MSLFFDCADPVERAEGLDTAVDSIRRGDLVVLPTDTVYGIAADAFKPWAVARCCNAKGRGRHMPPPVLVGSRQTLDGLVFSSAQEARDLVEAFWPGALTIVVEHAPTLQWDLGDTGGTVAVRMPLHPVALEVLPTPARSAVQGQPDRAAGAGDRRRRPASSSGTRSRSTSTAARAPTRCRRPSST